MSSYPGNTTRTKWANGKRTLGTVLVFAATCFDSPTITSRMSRIPLQIFHTATCVAIIFAKAWVTKIFSSSNFAFTAEFPYPTSRAQTLNQISRMAKKNVTPICVTLPTALILAKRWIQFLQRSEANFRQVLRFRNFKGLSFFLQRLQEGEHERENIPTLCGGRWLLFFLWP